VFYLASKLFWFLFAPSHVAVWLVLAAAILLWRKRQRWALRCAIAAGAILVACGFTPFGIWLMHPVENAYPRAALPAHIDGILILGGGTDARIFATRGAPNSSYGLARLMAGYQLARQHPEARVVFCGSTYNLPPERSEAAVAGKILIALGLPPQRLLLEKTSLNTWHNFVNARALANAKDGESWVLVTSAFHLPRAMAISERVGWKMLPWPSDYSTGRGSRFSLMDFTGNLERTDLAVHEGIGMLAYRLSGKAG